jgi:hypothetical protein
MALSEKWVYVPELELMWHDGTLGVWCSECAEFVVIDRAASKCAKCGAAFRVAIMVKKAPCAQDLTNS